MISKEIIVKVIINMDVGVLLLFVLFLWVCLFVCFLLWLLVCFCFVVIFFVFLCFVCCFFYFLKQLHMRQETKGMLFKFTTHSNYDYMTTGIWFKLTDITRQQQQLQCNDFNIIKCIQNG